MVENKEIKQDSSSKYVLDTVKSLFFKYQELSNEVVRLKAELEKQKEGMQNDVKGFATGEVKTDSDLLKREIEEALTELDECIELLNK